MWEWRLTGSVLIVYRTTLISVLVRSSSTPGKAFEQRGNCGTRLVDLEPFDKTFRQEVQEGHKNRTCRTSAFPLDLPMFSHCTSLHIPTK
ncbi:hypothetical protein DFJ77DRAFT_221729 [Powellomyces hirtus]|nr:hypothetical protein DFJ77DRAFT_221729 [Powellomyces hirtus]